MSQWTCADVGTPAFQGYASQTTIATMRARCSHPTPGGTLPFTGRDLGVVLMLALVLLAVGYCVRRAAR